MGAFALLGASALVGTRKRCSARRFQAPVGTSKVGCRGIMESLLDVRLRVWEGPPPAKSAGWEYFPSLIAASHVVEWAFLQWVMAPLNTNQMDMEKGEAPLLSY